MRFVLFDWGGTLMSEEGPLDIPMAQWPEVRAIDGARATLAALAPHLRLALATNATISSREMIRRALERAALAEFIGEIFCYREMHVRKDDPLFWEHVLQRLGASAAEVAMVGDSLEQDVIAPRRAAIHSIWFNANARHPGPRLPYPTVERLEEVVPLLLAWGRAM